MKLEKFIPCGNCEQGYIFNKDFTQGEKCKCLTNYQKRQYLRLKLEKSGIPSGSVIDYNIRHYIGKESKSEIKKLRKYINEFEKKFTDKHLYLYGKPGTQKTTLAYWIGRELLKKNIDVQYIFMDNLVKLLQKEDFEEEINLNKYRNADCLIVDRTFVKEQVTLYKSSYQIPFLDSFLRQRLDQFQKSTIFISNSPADKINENGFGEDIEDLVRRKTEPFNTIIEFKDHYTKKDDFDKISLWED